MGKGSGGTSRERHDAFSKERRARFIEALAETCNVAHSARVAGVGRMAAYRRNRSDPAFAAEWAEALAQGYARLEEKLLAHALAAVTGTGDGEPVDPADTDALRAPGPDAGVTAGRSPFTDTRLGLALLNRHAASVRGGRMAGIADRHRATPEATDAALCRQLDALARARRAGS